MGAERHDHASRLGKKQHVTYKVAKTFSDVEGDITYWELLPTENSLQEVPAAKGTRILIYND